jgi:peptidoglycan/LPS O-acetylase OafA/YrhL
MTASTRQIDFSILDSLRGVAALYVVIKHCRGLLFAGLNDFIQLHPRVSWSFYDYATLLPLMATRLGREFVIFFFVLSGFSIAHSLRNKPSIPGFFLRRAIRLYPPYVFALVWAVAVFLVSSLLFPLWYSQPTVSNSAETMQVFSALYHSRDFLSFNSIFNNLLYLPKGAFISQFWSLTYEVIFYLLVPLFLLNSRIYTIVSIVLYIGSWFVQLPIDLAGTILAKYALEFNFYFAIGVFSYLQWPRLQKTLLLPKPLFIAICLLLFLIILALNLKLGHITRYSSLVSALLSLVLMANFLGHDIKIKPLMWIGKFSYSLYITHVATIYCFIACLYLCTPIRLPIYSRWLWMAGIPFSILVGYVSYLLVEKQMKALLDKLRR